MLGLVRGAGRYGSNARRKFIGGDIFGEENRSRTEKVLESTKETEIYILSISEFKFE